MASVRGGRDRGPDRLDVGPVEGRAVLGRADVAGDAVTRQRPEGEVLGRRLVLDDLDARGDLLGEAEGHGADVVRPGREEHLVVAGGVGRDGEVAEPA